MFKNCRGQFEFGMLGRETNLLVSAAYTDVDERNAQGQRFVIKLKGRPILLEKERILYFIPPHLSDDQIRSLTKYQKWVFKSKPRILDPLMNELRLGLECPEKTLSYNNILFEIIGLTTVIVTWIGKTDITILKLVCFYDTYCLSLSSLTTYSLRIIFI